MSAHICFAVGKNCYNLYDSYGVICVGCGCCSTNKEKRYTSRLKLNKRMLKEQYEFNLWDDDPEMRALQEKNITENIAYFEKEIAKYEKKLAELLYGGAEG